MKINLAAQTIVHIVDCNKRGVTVRLENGKTAFISKGGDLTITLDFDWDGR